MKKHIIGMLKNNDFITNYLSDIKSVYFEQIKKWFLICKLTINQRTFKEKVSAYTDLQIFFEQITCKVFLAQNFVGLNFPIWCSQTNVTHIHSHPHPYACFQKVFHFLWRIPEWSCFLGVISGTVTAVAGVSQQFEWCILFAFSPLGSQRRGPRSKHLETTFRW